MIQLGVFEGLLAGVLRFFGFGKLGIIKGMLIYD